MTEQRQNHDPTPSDEMPNTNGHWPVLSGYQPDRMATTYRVIWCARTSFPFRAASCRTAQPSWLCYLKSTESFRLRKLRSSLVTRMAELFSRFHKLTCFTIRLLFETKLTGLVPNSVWVLHRVGLLARARAHRRFPRCTSCIRPTEGTQRSCRIGFGK